MAEQFTKAQLDDWRAYEKVRKGGRWNMYDPQAFRATGLTGDQFLFVWKNYTELKEAAEKE